MRLIILFAILLFFSACTIGQATESIGKPLTCIDSDGGKDYESAGTVLTKSSTGATTTHVDTCEDEKLLEYYCDGGNYPRKEVISCYCKYGVCI